MTEGQSPRQAAMPRFDTLAGIQIEEVQALEELSRRIADDTFDVDRCERPRDDERKVELRRRHRRQGLVPATGAQRGRTLGSVLVLPASGRMRVVHATEAQLHSESGRG